MAPRGVIKRPYVLFENDYVENIENTVAPSANDRKMDIVWPNIIIIVAAHIGAVYGAYLFIGHVYMWTRVLAYILYLLSGLGITAGVHRLWSHRSYKARFPLRVALALFNTIAFQYPVLKWARDHRVHHKYSETDADPHNATRGFFFSHVGWLLVRKHPEVIAKGRTIDLSDLYADPVLRFQNKHYMKIMLMTCFILPTYIPTLWGESAWNAFFVCGIFRFIFGMHLTWLINSAAHKWGNRPYDKNINPAEIKPVSLLVFGEGYHNYHHTFPWDYKTSELGSPFNFTKLFIDTMAKLGLAYDLKTVSPEVVAKRKMRTGDGSKHDMEDEFPFVDPIKSE
ncbi:acyl-CoA Delta-9 desaturase-like [Achroia grisella]|uniref:acyl-CoA Delta-9 desaturase-like n=1 Tax=Achroia grisella TaxID=688607 RepID=UPI0027D271C2|nr:acyl-CoA Delta-9 desaturase-like [Achroia grisella]